MAPAPVRLCSCLVFGFFAPTGNDGGVLNLDQLLLGDLLQRVLGLLGRRRPDHLIRAG
jgi:hypothetical protein